MFFGLKGAPVTFQRLKNRVLVGLNSVKPFVYLEDIIVIGITLTDQEQNLRLIFERFNKHGLQLQPAKCEFLRREVTYLGLASISIVYLDEILIFIMEIPIIDNYEFILYKTIPLPIKLQNNTYTVVPPNSDYIAVDKSRLYYLKLSTLKISKCKTTLIN